MKKSLLILSLVLAVTACSPRKPADPDASALLTPRFDLGGYNYDCGIDTINNVAHSGIRYMANIPSGPVTVNIKCISQTSGLGLFKKRDKIQFDIALNSQPRSIYQFRAQPQGAQTVGWLEDVSGQKLDKDNRGPAVTGGYPAAPIP